MCLEARPRVVRQRTPTTSDVEAAEDEHTSDEDGENEDGRDDASHRKGSIRHLSEPILAIVHRSRPKLGLWMWTHNMFPTARELHREVESIVNAEAGNYPGMWSSLHISLHCIANSTSGTLPEDAYVAVSLGLSLIGSFAQELCVGS